MTGVVDRIEEGIAVVEWDDGSFENLAPDAFEGGTLPNERDVVVSEDGSCLRVDAAETERRLASARERMRGLFGRRRRSE